MNNNEEVQPSNQQMRYNYPQEMQTKPVSGKRAQIDGYHSHSKVSEDLQADEFERGNFPKLAQSKLISPRQAKNLDKDDEPVMEEYSDINVTAVVNDKINKNAPLKRNENSNNKRSFNSSSEDFQKELFMRQRTSKAISKNILAHQEMEEQELE